MQCTRFLEPYQYEQQGVKYLEKNLADTYQLLMEHFKKRQIQFQVQHFRGPMFLKLYPGNFPRGGTAGDVVPSIINNYKVCMFLYVYILSP